MSIPPDALPLRGHETSTNDEETPVLPHVQPKEPPSDASPESMLPPEAQGEVNGGPLGCCLGTIVGLFVTFSLVTSLSILLSNGGFLGFATIPGIIVGAILGGYFGWKVGKKIYREYQPHTVREKKTAQNLSLSEESSSKQKD